MGLAKRADGSNRITIDENDVHADTSFEVLTLLQKNTDNSRHLNIRHILPDNEKEETNKHATQHRRYPTLSLDNPTIATTTQQYKMNQTQRLNKAVVNTNKYQMEKFRIVDQDIGMNMLKRNTGSQLASEIEDKIQLSILKGDFDNLKNQGEPLPVKFENPLVDRTTDLAYDILKKNGIIPEWVELQKIVYSLKEDLRSRLKIEWCKRIQTLNGSNSNNDNDTISNLIMPSSTDIVNFHKEMVRVYAEDEAIINKKIDVYNVIGIMLLNTTLT